MKIEDLIKFFSSRDCVVQALYRSSRYRGIEPDLERAPLSRFGGSVGGSVVGFLRSNHTHTHTRMGTPLPRAHPPLAPPSAGTSYGGPWVRHD